MHVHIAWQIYHHQQKVKVGVTLPCVSWVGPSSSAWEPHRGAVKPSLGRKQFVFLRQSQVV